MKYLVYVNENQKKISTAVTLVVVGEARTTYCSNKKRRTGTREKKTCGDKISSKKCKKNKKKQSVYRKKSKIRKVIPGKKTRKKKKTTAGERLEPLTYGHRVGPSTAKSKYPRKKCRPSN